MQDKAPYFIAILLTGIAGFVDAVGFLTLGHIYTANMSGNSVALGIQVTSQNWPEALPRLCPVIGYVVGVLFCRLLIAVGARNRIRAIASITLLCEIALLAPASLNRHQPTELAGAIIFTYIALLSVAMGIQNATLTHFSTLNLNTGFVTGTLVKFAEQLTKYLTWLYDHLHAHPKNLAAALADSFEQKVFRIALWLACMWLAYVFGACCGTLGDFKMGLGSLSLPMLGLAILIAIDIRKPLAVIEEQEQAKLPG